MNCDIYMTNFQETAIVALLEEAGLPRETIDYKGTAWLGCLDVIRLIAASPAPSAERLVNLLCTNGRVNKYREGLETVAPRLLDVLWKIAKKE